MGGRERAVTLFEMELVMCESKLKEIKKKVGGGRRLNSLIGYVKTLEEKQKENSVQLESADGQQQGDSGDTLLESYRYPPAQIMDGECSLGRFL